MKHSDLKLLAQEMLLNMERTNLLKIERRLHMLKLIIVVAIGFAAGYYIGADLIEKDIRSQLEDVLED